MKKIGVISDIHGNFHALEAVAEELEREGVEEVWCLGDVIGYGAFPNECLEWVSKNCRYLVLGNHELALLNFVDTSTFSDGALKAILWTKEKIKREFIDYLLNKGVQILTEKYQLVHDTPESPGSMAYIITPANAYIALLRQKRPVCFFGHTHIPVIYKLDGAVPRKILPGEITLSEGRYLVNPGSVGQPRDGDSRASFIILHGDKVTFKRVRYDVRGAAKAILKAGLPEYLAVRLLFGG